MFVRPHRALLILLRVCGAGLLAAMAGIHVYLWLHGYRGVATIGALFLLNGVGGGVLTLAVLGSPGRFLGVVSALSAVFTAGTLGALVLSVTVGLLGFQESMSAPLAPTSLIVESAGVLVLGALAALSIGAENSNGSGRHQPRTRSVPSAGG